MDWTKLKIRVLGLLCSLPFASLFGYGVFFIVTYIQEWQGTNVAMYLGTGVSTIFLLSGLLRPHVYIGIFNLLRWLGKVADVFSIF